MMNDHDMRHDRSDTQDAAWASIQETLSPIRSRVLRVLAEEPRTCEAVEAHLSMKHQTAASAIHDLRRRGLIHDTGKRVPTSSGRKAIVWAVGPGEWPGRPCVPSKAEVVSAARELLERPTAASAAALAEVLERCGAAVQDRLGPSLGPKDDCGPIPAALY